MRGRGQWAPACRWGRLGGHVGRKEGEGEEGIVNDSNRLSAGGGQECDLTLNRCKQHTVIAHCKTAICVLYWLCPQAAAAASPPGVSLALVAEALAAEQQRLAVKVGALRRRRLEVKLGARSRCTTVAMQLGCAVDFFGTSAAQGDAGQVVCVWTGCSRGWEGVRRQHRG